MTGPGGENVKMKGKKFIAIMAIFIILCSIQAITALEDNNVTQTDVQPTESNTLGISEVIASDIQSNESQVQNNDANDTVQKNDLDVSNNIISSSAPNHDSGILGIANDNDLLGEDPAGPRPWAEWTPGTLVYGVDYDRDQAGNSTVPLDRFFKAVFWGIRDYIMNTGSPVREWDVFLNNKTFTGVYGDAAGPKVENTGYNSYGDRVSYLGMTRLAGHNMDNIEVTIHLYGGETKDDGKTSTLDLTNYSVNYSIIDFGTGNSSIQGINFKNFDVNAHTSTKDPSTTRPFIRKYHIKPKSATL